MDVLYYRYQNLVTIHLVFKIGDWTLFLWHKTLEMHTLKAAHDWFNVFLLCPYVLGVTVTGYYDLFGTYFECPTLILC